MNPRSEWKPLVSAPFFFLKKKQPTTTTVAAAKTAFQWMARLGFDGSFRCWSGSGETKIKAEGTVVIRARQWPVEREERLTTAAGERALTF